MRNLFLEHLTSRYKEISAALKNEQLLISSELWDKMMREFFDMEPQKQYLCPSVPCICKNYSNNGSNSGSLLIIGKVSKSQELNMACSFYGHQPCGSKKSRYEVQEDSPCGLPRMLQAVPNSVNEFYYPQQLLPYLYEIFKQEVIEKIFPQSFTFAIANPRFGHIYD